MMVWCHVQLDRAVHRFAGRGHSIDALVQPSSMPITITRRIRIRARASRRKCKRGRAETAADHKDAEIAIVPLIGATACKRVR